MWFVSHITQITRTLWNIPHCYVANTWSQETGHVTFECRVEHHEDANVTSIRILRPVWRQSWLSRLFEQRRTVNVQKHRRNLFSLSSLSMPQALWKLVCKIRPEALTCSNNPIMKSFALGWSMGTGTHSIMSHGLYRGAFLRLRLQRRSSPKKAFVSHTMEAFGDYGGGDVVSGPHSHILKQRHKDVPIHLQDRVWLETQENCCRA